MAMNLLLKCNDKQITKSFYQEILEFNVSDSPNNTCTVERENGIIIFTEENLWNDYPKCTGTVYFFINNVEKYFNAIKDKAIVLWPLQNMPHGTTEFGVKDCDGYQLAFAQRK